MAEFRKSVIWARWHGRLTDIVAACREAEVALTTWTGNQPTVKVDVRFKGGFSAKFNQLAELENLPERDLGDVRRIQVRLSPPAFALSPGVDLDLDSSGPAFSLSVNADDRARVEGLAARMAQLLKYEGRWPPVPSSVIRVVLIDAALLGYSVALYFSFPLLWWLRLASQNNKWDPAEIATFPILAVVFIGLATLVIWLTADLEVLPAGGRRRTNRFIGLAVSVVLGVVASVVGSVVYAIITRTQ